MSKQRVLIFSFAYYPYVGGAEVAIKEITDRLGEYDFDLITYGMGEEGALERVGRVNVYRIFAPTKFLYPILSFLKGVLLYKKKQHQIVWAVMANTGFAALGMKLLFPKLKFVLTIQEGDPISRIKRRVWFVYPIFKMIFKRANVVTAISTYLANFAKSMGSKNVYVVPNGVDLNKFRIKNEELRIREKNKIILITTSRLVKKNALDDIIRALKYLPENIVLKSIGSGEDEGALRDLSKELGVEGRVEFIPYLPHEKIVSELQGADIFIRPSLSEGLGNSFLEAMAVGLPIIGTRVGGIPDFLEDGQTGLFCNVNNPRDIADKVMALVKDGALYGRLSLSGRELVEKKYNWEIISREFIELFKMPFLS